MVKPCENEECGRPFIAARRDMRFCGASCRARAHTLKARRAKGLLGAAVTKGSVVTTATATPAATTAATATAGMQRGSAADRLDRLERQVVELAQALEVGRTDEVRGLAEVSAELRVGRERGEEDVAAIRARLDAAVAAEMKKAKAPAREARQLEARLTQIEARQERALSLL